MTSFINFTRDLSHPDRNFAGGLPLFDGKIPPASRVCRGVSLDGEPVVFKDSSTPERLHKAIIDGRKLGVFDCLIFAALMYGVPIGQPDENELFRCSKEVKAQEIKSNDVSTTSPLNLGTTRRDSNHISYVHTIVPAHTPEGSAYIHKLGKNTLCFSTLSDAMRLYRATVAHPMIWIEFDGQERFDFTLPE